MIPVQSLFPNFDDTLREGLRRETELFFASVLREDRSVLELLDADYTFVNERVARHYGIANVKGSHFRRVQLPEGSPRRGLLGHGSVLAVTSRADRTSPVVRGPVDPREPVRRRAAAAARERAAARRDERDRRPGRRVVAARAAHGASGEPDLRVVPSGDGFARLRARGVRCGGPLARHRRGRDPIDASGVLPDGSTFQSFDEFRATLKSSELFRLVLAEKLMTYALGRGVEHYDMPAVRAIVRDAANEDNRFLQFILGVVNSTPFQMRRTAL